MKGIEIQEFLRCRGWSVSKIADLMGESRQHLNNMLSKDDVRTGLVERLSSVTGIPILEFYGTQSSCGCTVLGEANILNNGHDQHASDPGLVAVIGKQAGVIQEQSAQIGQLIRLVENLTNSAYAK